MPKKCAICNIEKNEVVRINSMETYMQFRVKKRLKGDLCGGFVCLDCREQLVKELKEESGGIEIY